MSIQGEIVYTIFAILMVVAPIIAGMQRYGIPAVIYLIGIVIFVASLFQDKGGWEDLANFATLLVVVLPIYIIGTIVWVWSAIRRKRAQG
jgi:hypothetical protein